MTLSAGTRGVIAKRLVWPRRVWRITEVGNASKLGAAASHRISGSARAERSNIQGATAERSRRCNGIRCCRGLRASIFSQRTARPREVVHPDLISREGIVINSHFVDGAVDWWSNTGSSPRLIIWSDLDLVRGVKQEWNARREVLLAYQVPSRGHAIPRESETAQTTRRARTSFAGSFVRL